MRFSLTFRSWVVLSISVAALLVSASAFAAPPCPDSQPLGLLGYAQSVGNLAVGIDVEGKYAYVGDWHQGNYHAFTGVLQVFDVTDPCNPMRLPGSVETPPYRGSASHEIGDVAVHGTRAYLANSNGGFAVYDITDPNNPVRLDSRVDGAYALNVFYDGEQYAYVGYGSSPNGELAIYDVSTLPLAAPTIFSTGTTRTFDVFVAGARAYVYGSLQLDILDVSNPRSPVKISTLPLPYEQYGAEGEVRVQGNYAYLALGENGNLGGLRVVDISDEANPRVVARFDLPGGAGVAYAKGIGLAVVGTRVYIAAKGGLWVFDVSAPTTPVLVHNFPLPAAFTNSIGEHVEVRDNLAYVTAYALGPPWDLDTIGVGGLAIYNIAEDGVGPNDTYVCIGFGPPIGDMPVSVKKNRALPFKAQLRNSLGAMVTDLDLSATPPVLQVIYSPETGASQDVTDLAVPVGWKTTGNQFEYAHGKWRFNLDTRAYTAPGTYTVTMARGQSYSIQPTCTGSFVIK